jgi:hypothetical protein
MSKTVTPQNGFDSFLLGSETDIYGVVIKIASY